MTTTEFKGIAQIEGYYVYCKFIVTFFKNGIYENILN